MDIQFSIDSFKSNPTLETIVHQVLTRLDSIRGISSDIDGMTSSIVSFAQNRGYLKADGRIKPLDTLVNLSISNVQDSTLRSVFGVIHANKSYTGLDRISWVQSLLSGITSNDPYTDDQRVGYGEVYTKSAVYCMGKEMPESVSEADAMGWVDGYQYAMDVGDWGTDDHGMPLRYGWAIGFSMAYSNAVACSHPNAH